MMRRTFLLAAMIVITFVQPARAQSSTATDKNVYNGWKWSHVYCYRCHGMNAIRRTLAPNLIDPNEKLTLQFFRNMLRKASADPTMHAWHKILDDKQITQLY